MTRRTRTAAMATLATILTASAPAIFGQEANPADVETIDGLIEALYGSISGPVGKARDEARFKSLFAPDGKLIPTTRAPQATNGYLYWTPDDYWRQSSAMLARIGFTETEIGRTTETFGQITHVFSTYESYRTDQGEPDEPFDRGINSIQLVRKDGRYWILNIFWSSEGSSGETIPTKYIGD